MSTDVESTVVSESGTSTTAKYLRLADFEALPQDERVKCRESLTPLAGLIRDEWIEVSKEGDIIIYSSYALFCNTGSKQLTFLENIREPACAILLENQKGRKNYLYLGEIKGGGTGEFDYRFLQNVYIAAILQLSVSQDMKTIFMGGFTHGDYLDDALVGIPNAEGTTPDEKKASVMEMAKQGLVTQQSVDKARMDKIKPVRFYLWCITTPTEDVKVHADKLVTAALPWTSPKTGTTYSTIDEIRMVHADYFKCLASTTPDAPPGFELDMIGNPDKVLYPDTFSGKNVPIMDLYFPKSAKKIRDALASKKAGSLTSGGTGAAALSGAVGEGAGMFANIKPVHVFIGFVVAAAVYYFGYHKKKSSFGRSSQRALNFF